MVHREKSVWSGAGACSQAQPPFQQRMSTLWKLVVGVSTTQTLYCDGTDFEKIDHGQTKKGHTVMAVVNLTNVVQRVKLGIAMCSRSGEEWPGN